MLPGSFAMSSMSTVPKSRSGLRNFYRVRAHKWAERAGEIGIDPARAAELAALALETEQAFGRQLQAMRAARGATLRYNELLKELGTQGAMLLKQIHSQAGANRHVYELAQLAPPDLKSPIGPPGEPYGFTTALSQSGALTLRWKCDHPRGAEQTAYNIFRRNGHTGPFLFVGTVARKTLEDATIPPGTPSVTYRIHAFRTTGAGPAAEFNVSFGGGRMPEVEVAKRKAA